MDVIHTSVTLGDELQQEMQNRLFATARRQTSTKPQRKHPYVTISAVLATGLTRCPFPHTDNMDAGNATFPTRLSSCANEETHATHTSVTEELREQRIESYCIKMRYARKLIAEKREEHNVAEDTNS